MSADRPVSPGAHAALPTLLDVVVPPSGDGRLPGAGALGLAGDVEATLRERPELGPLLAQGLETADAVAREHGATGFAQLSAEARPAAVRDLADRSPALLPTLALLTFSAYYRHPRVLEALGLEARPPWPRGYEVPPTDFGLLEPVRRRAKLYREL